MQFLTHNLTGIVNSLSGPNITVHGLIAPGTLLTWTWKRSGFGVTDTTPMSQTGIIIGVNAELAFAHVAWNEEVEDTRVT